MQKSIPFLSIDSIKSLFGDWLHWKLPSALDYSCTVPISFFTVQRYGHLFYYTARCKAWNLNIRDHTFLRIILCTDSRTSVWALGIALLSQISVITLVIPFQDPFSPIKIKMCVSWNLNTTPKWNDSTCFQLPADLFCPGTDDSAHNYFSAVGALDYFMVKLSLSAICSSSEV